MITIEVTEDFINHREAKAALYNRRGRSELQFYRDLDAEILEHHMIKEGHWDDHEDWRVDAITARGNIDVKFIYGYYNITPTKMLNILQQRDILDGFLFMQWDYRPNGRALRLGDRVDVSPVGYADYDRVADRTRVSFKDGGKGFYFDARKLVLKADRDVSDLLNQV